MDKQAVDEATGKISKILDELFEKGPPDEGFDALVSVVLRMTTYPMVFLNEEGRETFIKSFGEDTIKHLHMFNRYLTSDGKRDN
jgi:hypothetical protein